MSKAYPLLALLLLFFITESYAVAKAATSSLTKQEVLELVKTPAEDEPEGLIQLPLRVHLISELEMEKKGKKMEVWVSPEDFEKKVLPEINRIWEPANIQWVIEEIFVTPVADLPNKDELVTYVENAVREDNQSNSSKRVPYIFQLCSDAPEHKSIQNLYIFPYIGETNQGFASMGGNKAVVAAWSDKSSRAQKAPEKLPLTERPPFKVGSIARTCGHELGHNLNLKHPDKKTQTEFNRLMGGNKPGYELIPEEIKTARKAALKRAEFIRKLANK